MIRGFACAAFAVAFASGCVSAPDSRATVRTNINAGATYSLAPIAFQTLFHEMASMSSPTATANPGFGSFAMKPKTATSEGGSIQITFPSVATAVRLECEIGRGMPFLVTVSGASGAATTVISTTTLPGKVGNYLVIQAPAPASTQTLGIVLKSQLVGTQDWNVYNCEVTA